MKKKQIFFNFLLFFLVKIEEKTSSYIELMNKNKNKTNIEN